MTPHPICMCKYCTYTLVYAPYRVSNHPHIPSLGYLHIPSPSRLPSSISPNLPPPDERPCSSRRLSEHRMIRRNKRSNLLKRRRIYDSRRRKEEADLESQSVHAYLSWSRWCYCTKLSRTCLYA